MEDQIDGILDQIIGILDQHELDLMVSSLFWECEMVEDRE